MERISVYIRDRRKSVLGYIKEVERVAVKKGGKVNVKEVWKKEGMDELGVEGR